MGLEPTPLKALLVEGSPVAAGLLGQVLRASFTRSVDIHAVTTPDAAPPVLGGWDLVLVDIDLDPESALDLLSRVRDRTWCLATTLYEDEDRLLPALRCGIHGYLLKQDRLERQIESLQRAVGGMPEITPALARAMLQHLRADGSGADPMVKVLSAIGRGASMREASRELNISMPAIESMVSEVYRALGRSSPADRSST